MKVKSGLFISVLFILQALAGCTSQVLDTKVDPKAMFTATPNKIQQGEEVTFDARDSNPIEGTITEYLWDFDDGNKATTISAFTSHQFLDYGSFNVKLTVTNDQGGTDSTNVMVKVNGAPQLNLTYPETVRSGDIIVLDASRTFDPEDNKMDFKWDINHLEDSNGDGDPRNDVDFSDSILYLPTNSSGLISGSLTVDDNNGGVAIEFSTSKSNLENIKLPGLKTR